MANQPNVDTTNSDSPGETLTVETARERLAAVRLTRDATYQRYVAPLDVQLAQLAGYIEGRETADRLAVEIAAERKTRRKKAT